MIVLKLEILLVEKILWKISHETKSQTKLMNCTVFFKHKIIQKYSTTGIPKKFRSEKVDIYCLWRRIIVEKNVECFFINREKTTSNTIFSNIINKWKIQMKKKW